MKSVRGLIIELLQLSSYVSSEPHFGGVLLEQVQLQRLVQVQLPVAPALQEVTASCLQTVQQRGNLWRDALEVCPARQPAAVTTAAAAFSGGIAVRGSKAHALEQTPPFSLKGVDGCCGDGVTKTAVFLEESNEEKT